MTTLPLFAPRSAPRSVPGLRDYQVAAVEAVLREWAAAPTLAVVGKLEVQ